MKEIKTMEEKKSCQNCKYYVPYYIKRGSWFSRIDFGHCGFPKRDEPPELCENWAICDMTCTNSVQTLKNHLISLSIQLQQVAETIENIEYK